jgi:type III pantothenate kinase
VNASAATSLLVIDAGNSRIKLGLLDVPAAEAVELPACRESRAFSCGMTIDSAVLRELMGTVTIPAFISGSNPREVDRIRQEWPPEIPRPALIQDRSRFPLTIDVDYPEKVGIDRLLNAVAANVIRRTGQPAVMISSGTATTVDYLSAAGNFCGGAILPGFDLCGKALHEYTQLLPLIRMDAVLDSEIPPAELGRNTQAAIISGLYWGHVGAVKELMRRLMLGGDPHIEPLILLTGGAAPLLYPHLPTIVRHEPHLSLQGLAVVAATTGATAAVPFHSPASRG